MNEGSTETTEADGAAGLPLRWVVILAVAAAIGIAVGAAAGVSAGVMTGFTVAGFLHLAVP